MEQLALDNPKLKAIAMKDKKIAKEVTEKNFKLLTKITLAYSE